MIMRKRTNKPDVTAIITVTEWDSSCRCPPALEVRHRLKLLDRGQLNRRFPYQNEILFSLVFEGVHICCISGQFFLLQLNKQRNKYLQRKRTNKFDFTPGIAVTEWESSNRCPPAFEGRHRLQLYCTEVSSIEDFRTKMKLFSLGFVSCPHLLHFRSNKQTNK